MSDETTPTAPIKKSHKKKAAAAPTVQTGGMVLSAEQFLMLMQQQAEILRNNKDADIEAAATINARAMKKALRPENEIAPGVSIYNPKGERDCPRPKPTHIYMLAQYPICDPGNYDTTTWTELELLNRLQPGEYPVTKSDGSEVKVLVKTEFNSGGKPYKTTLFADGKGLAKDDPDQKTNWPPLVQLLTQMITGERPQESYARYQDIIDRLQAENAALKAATAA